MHPFTVPGRGQGWNQVAIPYVATPAVLSLYGLSPADIDRGSDILSSRRDLSGIELGTGFKGDFQPVTVQRRALLPNYTSAPNTLLTPKAMAANGYTAEPVGWLVQAKHPITSAQLTDARQPRRRGGDHHREPDRSGPHACSTCATTRRWPARSWRWAYWP